MVGFKDTLLVFGGSEGGDEDTEPYNDLWAFNLDSREWYKPRASGRFPAGRDGHSAGVLKNHMLIYGGVSMSKIFADIRVLNLSTWTWVDVEIRGENPGPRESMGYTVASGKLYVFGGNVRPPAQVDEYTNDFFELSLSKNEVLARRISGHAPPPRLSCTLSNMKNKYLFLFGGEGQVKILNDLWVYDLTVKCWKELHPANAIEPRMIHMACAYNDSFIVYGGMDEYQKPSNDMSIIRIGGIRNDPASFVSTRNQHAQNTETRTESISLCPQCGHTSAHCEFSKRFPEVSSSGINFYLHVATPFEAIQAMSIDFKDEFSALLRVCSLLGPGNISIKIIGKAWFRSSSFIKEIPSVSQIDLKYMELEEEDEHFEIREDMLKSWKTGLEEERIILEVSVENRRDDPGKVASICSSEKVLVPLLKISDIILVISRTEEFLTVGLVQKTNSWLPMYFMVFDNNFQPVFPHEDFFYPNYKYILNNSHLTIDKLKRTELGTRYIIFPKEMKEQNGEIQIENISFSALLSFSWFSPPFPQRFECNEQSLQYFNMKNANKIKVDQVSDTKYYTTKDIDEFVLLIYYWKKLIYWEYRPSTTHHGETSKETTVVVTKDKNAVSEATGLIHWDAYTMRLFYQLPVLT